MKPLDGNEKLREYLREHKLWKHWKRVTASLAALTLVGSTALMVMPAITLEQGNEMLECQLQLHTHTDSCYDEAGNIICGYADFVVHTHDGSCYGEDGALICPLEEIEPHTHTASCYQQTSALVCGLEESEGHVHDDSCYAVSEQPACGLEECAPHVHTGHIHTEECYQVTKTLICGQEESPEHTHTEACYETQKILTCTQDTGCYDENGVLVCTIPEGGHVHTEECYPKVLVCGQEEAAPHTHTDSCYEVSTELICGKQEIILHTHTDSCYDENGQLICGMLEVKQHVHDESCLPASAQDDQDGLQSQLLTTQMSALADATPLATGIDFGQYLTYIAFSKTVDGQWVPATEVTTGDTVQLAITYTIPDNVVTSSSRTIYYQLPAGIGLKEPASGQVNIKRNDTTLNAGTYSISTDGLIVIEFVEQFVANGAGFSGDLQFQGLITATGEEGDNQIEFDFDGMVITVNPSVEDAGLSIEKTNWYDAEQNLINYQIVISSEKASNGAITLEDCFVHPTDYGKITYGASISVEKIKADQSSETLTGYNWAVTQQTDSEAASFTLTGLPALEEGESIVIYYTATPDLSVSGDPDGYTEFTNLATARDDVSEVQASSKVMVAGAMVKKEGYYDPVAQIIYWTITLNESQQDISGWKLEDTLTYTTADGQVVQMNLPATVSMQAYDQYQPVGAAQNISIPYVFDEGATHQYVITYQTAMTEVGYPSYLTFHNRVKLGKYEAEIDVNGYGTGEYGIVKGLTAADSDTGMVQWMTTITHPEQAQLDQLLYVDFIPNVMLEDGSYPKGSHYTTKALLTGSGGFDFYAGNDKGTVPLVYGADYTILAIPKETVDANRDNFAKGEEDLVAYVGYTDWQYLAAPNLPWQPLAELADDMPLGMFAIQFTESALEKIGSDNIVLIYYTKVDQSKLPEGTEKVTMANLGRIQSGLMMPTGEMSFLEKLNKQASLTGAAADSTDTGSYTDEALEVNSGDAGNLLHYRILITDYSAYTPTPDGITVTDTLPAGAELVEGSVVLRTHPDGFDTGTVVSNESNYYLTATSTKNDDGTTTVAFSVSHLSEFSRVPIGIYYDVSVAGDTQLEEAGQKVYVNTVTWDGRTDSTSTTVYYARARLEKTVEQQQAEDGTLSTVLHYYIAINPDGEDINPYNDQLVLEDTLQVPAGASANLLLNTVKLYQYDADAQQSHFCGAVMDPDDYSVQYDADANKSTFSIPDRTACVLAYDYVINQGTAAGDLQILNTVSLSGHDGISSESEIEIQEQQSSASVNKATVTIYKYDADNMALMLPGAKFRLERYEEKGDGSGYEWKQTTVTAGADGLFEVGESGTIVLSFISETTLNDNLYRMQEAQAPEGYVKSDTFYYFIWGAQQETREAAIERMQENGAIPADVDPEDIEFIAYSTTFSIYVPNESDALAVVKKWKNDAGQDLENPPVTAVEVQLYQWCNGTKTAYETPVQLTADNEWTYVWTGLPKKDEQGNPFTYTVEEEALAGFEVTYQNNKGIQTGTIEITNTRNRYVLPETGGEGLARFAAAGLALAGTAALLCLGVRRRKRQF